MSTDIPDSPFAFVNTTEEGATYTPWTDGRAVGFRVTGTQRSDRWVYLSPSDGEAADEPSVDIFLDPADPAGDAADFGLVMSMHIWCEDSPRLRPDATGPTTPAADPVGAPFAFTLHTVEGATYTPFTDGWAVGFQISAAGRPDRWVCLNPSQTDDLGEANVFVYNDPHSPAESRPVESVCYINIWDDDEPCEECGAAIPATVSSAVNRHHGAGCSLHPANLTPGARLAERFTPAEVETLLDTLAELYGGGEVDDLSRRQTGLADRLLRLRAGTDAG